MLSPPCALRNKATPTIAEAGYPEYDAGNWYGLVVPLKTPHSIVVTLRNAALAALASPDTSRRLTEPGYVAVGDQPQEFAAHMRNKIGSLTRSFRAMSVRTEKAPSSIQWSNEHGL